MPTTPSPDNHKLHLFPKVTDLSTKVTATDSGDAAYPLSKHNQRHFTECHTSTLTLITKHNLIDGECMTSGVAGFSKSQGS